MEHILGRNHEKKFLKNLSESDKSAFLVILGRRRVGKTFLIRKFFENQISFYLTGIANVNLNHQLANFHSAIQLQSNQSKIPIAKDWFMAFKQLREFLENKSKEEKKIVFLDELPWLDNSKSNFISALEHFWNSWASQQNDIILIGCGSATSWMINKLINNKGGLHNRVTHKIKLEPFTLAECEEYFTAKNSIFDRYQLLQLYMAIGGIPYYLDLIDINKSAAQNINDLYFEPNGMLRNEFDNLYASLFKKSEKYIAVIEALATKTKGLSRDEILDYSKLPNAGSTTRILKELEESNFIRRYNSFGKLNRESLYQLVDFYSLFYLKFIKKSNEHDKNYWLKIVDMPEARTWSGYAFEQVCLWHLPQLKKAMGIDAVLTNTSSWVGKTETQKAQIDLLIDRRDHVINVCEIKFSVNEFVIDKQYAESLRKKVSLFKQVSKTKKAIMLTMITTYGLVRNAYSTSIVNKDYSMDVLFE